MNILVTGANGFIGSALVSDIEKSGHNAISTERQKDDLKDGIDLEKYLINADCVIHLANIAHQSLSEQVKNKLIYREVNVEGTANLAKRAAKAGVKKFIYLSSVAVHLNKKRNENNNIDESSEILRQDLSVYAKSKYDAELKLLEMIGSIDMDIIIIRPPMVYGETAIGNFDFLLKLIKYRIPLPIGLLNTKRSFLYLHNLTDFLIHVAEKSNSINDIFLVSDGESILITDFIRQISDQLKVKTLFLPVPMVILRFIINYFFKKKGIQLLESCCLDISKANLKLGWNPPFQTKEAIRNIYENKKKRGS